MKTVALMDIWKLTLAWGCLLVFFGFPIVSIAIHVFYSKDKGFADEFRYLGEYGKTVTAIIISLAGLNTVEIFRPRRAQESNPITTDK